MIIGQVKHVMVTEPLGINLLSIRKQEQQNSRFCEIHFGGL